MKNKFFFGHPFVSKKERKKIISKTKRKKEREKREEEGIPINCG